MPEAFVYQGHGMTYGKNEIVMPVQTSIMQAYCKAHCQRHIQPEIMVKNMKCEALTSWEDFVRDVAKLFDQGKRDVEISEKFRGAGVKWRGRVVDIKLDEKFAPGIALSMSPEEYPLSAGKTLRSDYLFLNTDSKEKSTWKNCRIGDRVEFSAKISKSLGPFNEIRLSEFDDDPEVVLMIGLYDPVLIANL